MRPGRCAYEIPGVARGELWLRGSVLLHHELVLVGVDHADDAPGLAGARARAAEAASRRSRPLPSAPDGPSAGRRTSSPTGRAEPPLLIEPEAAMHDRSDLVADVCRRIRDHLLGRPVDYADVAIDLDGHTALQRALAGALRGVPWGEVVTYGELAALAGRPGAARAAGAFCAESTWSLVVPCHRVVAANGLGGYGATGTATKRHLLALEGVAT